MSDEGSGLKMRYSRERRLERAGIDVRRMYERRAEKNGGFFSFLRKNRGLAYVFVTIIAFALLLMAYPYLTGQDRGTKLGAYRVWIQATREGSEIAMSVEAAFSSRFSKPASDGTLVLRCSVDGSVFNARAFALSGAEREKFFFRLDGQGAQSFVECLVRLGDSEASLRVQITPEGAATEAGSLDE